MKRILVLCIMLLCIIPLTSAMKLTPATYGWENGCGAGANGNVSRSLDGSTDTYTGPTDALQCIAYYDFGQVVTMQDVSIYHNRWLWDSRPFKYSNTSGMIIPWTGSIPTGGWGRLNSTTNLTSFNNRGYVMLNDGGAFNLSEIEFYGYPGTTPPPPTANFTAAPLNATAPAYVAFTDTSENETGTCTYNWSFTPADGVLAAPQDLDNEDITILFTENGDFTISHGVSCDAGSNISTKTDYIHIYNSTALSTFRVRAVDAISGYGVNGAQVDVFDIENSSWTNQTSVTGEVTVSALTGHTINAYGSATGYDAGESLGLPIVHGSLYPIYMWPTDMGTNVSEGNVTVYVTVLEDGTNTRLPGYAVSLTGPSSGGADFTMGVTNENGIFQAVVKNQTNYNVKVLAQKGHLGANKNFNSGNQSGGDAYVEVTLWLGVNSITTAPTVTTLPGGGTPTPQVTYLPHCDPSAADYDEALCRASKGGVGLNILADYMDDLILLCIFVTIMYLLGFKLGS